MKCKSKKQLTNHEIRKYACFRCGKQGAHQWKICAYSDVFLILCLDCDILLNSLIADFLNLPAKIVIRYGKKMRKRHAEFNKEYPL